MAKNDQNCQKWQKMTKMVQNSKYGQNGKKWQK